MAILDINYVLCPSLDWTEIEIGYKGMYDGSTNLVFLCRLFHIRLFMIWLFFFCAAFQEIAFLQSILL